MKQIHDYVLVLVFSHAAVCGPGAAWAQQERLPTNPDWREYQFDIADWTTDAAAEDGNALWLRQRRTGANGRWPMRWGCGCGVTAVITPLRAAREVR